MTHLLDFHDPHHRTAATIVAIVGIVAVCGGMVLLAWLVDSRDARRAAREFKAARLARERGYGAEFFAEDREAFRRTDDDTFRNTWDDSTAAYLRDLNAQFDALLAGMPRSDDDPMPRDYWPAVAPITGAPTGQLTIGDLAEFAGPEGGLKLIERENDRVEPYPVRAAHLWATAEYAVVPIASVPPAPSAPAPFPRPRGRHIRPR